MLGNLDTDVVTRRDISNLNVLEGPAVEGLDIVVWLGWVLLCGGPSGYHVCRHTCNYKEREQRVQTVVVRETNPMCGAFCMHGGKELGTLLG